MKQLYIALVAMLLGYNSCSNQSTAPGLPGSDVVKLSADSAKSLFAVDCAVCHLDNGQSRAPGLIHLGGMTPKSIVASLESGRMQLQGETLSKQQKVAIAELLTMRPFVENNQHLNYCESRNSILSKVKYSGWGGNPEGTGFIEPDIAQLTADQVPNLKLKWAFGFEGGTVTRTKPTIIEEYLIFGSQFGGVYCLDINTGCVKWMFEADANVRGGMAVSEDINNQIIIYFADFGGNVYALKANDGKLIWKTSVKTEPNNAVTGTVAYFDGILYIPLTSMEVITAGLESYECCKGSGQVVAVNAMSGEEIWRHRVIKEPASERGTNAVSARTFGPSGSPVWSSPTIDVARGLLYIGTGENNSNPPTDNSDAIQALDLKTGSLVWNFQATSKDAYISACPDTVNCPDPPGLDVDFGMAPILTIRSDGKEVLIVGQKSGVVHCLDPDTGQPLWQKRIGRGGALGGIHWGMATDGKLAFAANSDWLPFGSDSTVSANPGLFALDLLTGEVVWKSTSDPNICQGKDGCYNSNSAAPTLIEGVVFAGSLDGHARAYNSNNGELIWDFDTHRNFETINGVEGHGGSIDGPGPVVAEGMVLFNSGYGLFGQMPGNVLLAFSLN